MPHAAHNLKPAAQEAGTNATAGAMNKRSATQHCSRAPYRSTAVALELTHSHLALESPTKVLQEEWRDDCDLTTEPAREVQNVTPAERPRRARAGQPDSPSASIGARSIELPLVDAWLSHHPDYGEPKAGTALRTVVMQQMRAFYWITEPESLWRDNRLELVLAAGADEGIEEAFHSVIG